jgi:hypothetical protein
MTRPRETHGTISDIIHYVDGECRIRPEVRARWEEEMRRERPNVTEEQILASWGLLEVTFGITIGPPEPTKVSGGRRS